VLRRLSLRARLVLGVLALAAAGLAAANVATYASLRSFLLERTDESLAELTASAERELEQDCYGHGGRGPNDGAPPGASPGDFFQLRTPGGDVVCARQVVDASGAASPPPALPETGGTGIFTVPAEKGGGRYRVRASPDRDGNVVVAATPLSDVDATLGRLIVIMLIVTVAVLVALAAVGLWVVRIGLRPLDEIGSTAAAIADGDLSRRVERADRHTEVGRLGRALNAMLGQIESAFHAKDASERMLRRFVADASHELRTPLAAVRAYAELFSRGADRRPDDLARSMAGIRRESERMSVLVDDLLLLARLDEGRPLDREPVRLDDVVREAVDTARAVDPERRIDAELAAAPVVGDHHRLRQLVDNLLGNARVHTPRDAPVRVRLSTDHGQAVVEVEDAGPGLRAGEAERVFERFYRADESRSRGSGGVGLGLAIVAAVAAAHGGAVAARSVPGEGATFAVTLPLAHSQETPSGF
jgi:two-component system, OmpR family, sensor kinase